MIDENRKPSGCPKCGKFNININDPFNDENYSIYIECYDCGILWKETYRFKSWEMVEDYNEC